jgi:large subunit ribosomal protein L13
MSMNRTFYVKKEDRAPQWVEIDAEGQILGRMATKIADILRGKHSPKYTPHTDAGDYVIVINADKVVLSGNKLTSKIYDRYSGWIGGYKTMTAQEMMDKDATEVIRLAVRRMLPKSKLSRVNLDKLKVYCGKEHPHQAQVNAQKKK